MVKKAHLTTFLREKRLILNKSSGGINSTTQSPMGRTRTCARALLQFTRGSIAFQHTKFYFLTRLSVQLLRKVEKISNYFLKKMAYYPFKGSMGKSLKLTISRLVFLSFSLFFRNSVQKKSKPLHDS